MNARADYRDTTRSAQRATAIERQLPSTRGQHGALRDQRIPRKRTGCTWQIAWRRRRGTACRQQHAQQRENIKAHCPEPL